MTRTVERTPWAERRSSRHDEICVLVMTHAKHVLTAWPILLENKATISRVTLEAECGKGFCDVLIDAYDPVRDIGVTIVVEVKTDNEKASAGDAIRQLKWYRKQLQEVRLSRHVLLCVIAESYDDTFRAAVTHESIALATPEHLEQLANDATSLEFIS